jgi:PAS domain S-box-containing protein
MAHWDKICLGDRRPPDRDPRVGFRLLQRHVRLPVAQAESTEGLQMANRRTRASAAAHVGVAEGVGSVPKPARVVSVGNGGASSALIAPFEDQRFELAMAKVVSNFADSPETLDRQFEPALCEFVSALDIERSTIYLSGDRTIYSWAKPGVSPAQTIHAGDFPHTWKTIKENGSFEYSSPEELPTASGEERDYYRENGPASLLMLPLIAAGNVFGGIAFETITYTRIWPDELRQRLKLIADLFASGLVISQAKEELAAQLRFERCISDVSASLVNLPAEQTDQRITEALREIADVLRLQRVGFFERNPIEEHFTRTHVWVRDGLAPLPRQLLRDHSHWLVKRLLAGQTFQYSSLSEMPPETRPLRNFLEKHGIRSFLVIPLSIGGRVVALTAIAGDGPDSLWDSVLIRRLTLLGETLANALVRHRQDDIVAAHQERLRLAMFASRSFGWDWNVEAGSSVWFGDSNSIFGVSPDSHPGGIKEFLQYVHPDDRDRVQRSLNHAIRKHVPYEEEYRVVRADGCLRWASSRGSVLYAPDGSPKRMTGIAADITDRKEGEIARSQAEARYRQLLESIDAIAWRADPESILCSFVSPQAEQILGYPVERWLQEPNFWRDHVHPDDRDWVIGACVDDIKRGDDHALEYRMIAADGRVVWLHDKAKAVIDRGKPVELIGIMVDITPLKEAEERLRTLGGRLIEAQELERRRIARELHDDINQRIDLIAIDLERFGKQHFGGEREIRAYARRLWTKTSEITSQISRLCGQLHSSKLEHLGLVAAIRDLCNVTAERHSVQIEFSARSVPRQLPEDVALCLFRICQESSTNIVKHSGCSRAKVKLVVKTGSVELIVTDNGRGFDPDARFGSGLGLISMQERASLLGGKFSVKSAPGSGTTVLARVPLPTAGRTKHKAGATL